MELIALIDKASAIAGSDYKLAQRMGISRGNVSDWRHGRKPCSLEDRFLLAAIAGENAVKELLTGMLQRHEGTPKGEILKQAAKNDQHATMYIM
jgi:DNA-binding transcriptional regulator YdaS (Cro superfamily)